MSASRQIPRRSNPLIRGSRPRRREDSFLNSVAIGFLGFMLVTTFVVSAVLLAVFGFGVASEMYSYATRDLPPVDEVFSKSVFQSTMIYDRKGRLLYEMFDPQGGRRTLVTLQDIPQSLTDATVSTEDGSFYTNPGVDPVAIVRASFEDAVHRQVVSGASTITQQLVRNVLMTPAERQSQSLSRKIEEAILAFRVSQSYSKDEILQRYLNEIWYGNLAYGVEAASETYFNKPVQQLSLAESALIAGLPQGPSLYDPYQHPKAAKARQLVVLQLMVKHGYITQAQADLAAAEPLHYHAAPTVFEAPHFVMYVRSLLEDRYTRQQLYEGGLRVYTSLDLDEQHQAETIVANRLATIKADNANNAAVVVLDPKTGEILAMVGSANFDDDAIQGQINMALTARQPGSTLKPFNYLYAFEHRLATPTTILMDSPVKYSMGAGLPPYEPHDADLQFRGPVTVRRALANSLNVPAVEMLNLEGIPELLQTLHLFGITTLLQPPGYYGLSLTLGSGPVRLLDLTFAYATLANGGVQVGEPVTNPQPGQSALEPVAILKVTDAKGKVLYNYHPPTGIRQASPQATWLITDILADDAARAETFGAHSYLELDRPAAVKTGTTEQFQDSWTMGYTPQLVVGVWVGNANDQPMKNVFGARGAGLIWHEFMETALKGQPVLQFNRPSGLVRASVDAETGLRPVPGRPSITDWFIAGTLPTESAPVPTPTPLPPTPVPTATPIPPTSTPVRVPERATPISAPSNPNVVVVPNLVGMSEVDAQRVINQSGLATSYANYQTANDVPDRSFFLSVPSGAVLSQLPQ
ncbi:MAG TPA: transglycosylase domain-containing protein, partial [Chloroflexota bacterium]|nr:transglycosylase domain-containing protein [Chloroflexota bacterium]